MLGYEPHVPQQSFDSYLSVFERQNFQFTVWSSCMAHRISGMCEDLNMNMTTNSQIEEIGISKWEDETLVPLQTQGSWTLRSTGNSPKVTQSVQNPNPTSSQGTAIIVCSCAFFVYLKGNLLEDQKYLAHCELLTTIIVHHVLCHTDQRSIGVDTQDIPPA